MFDALTHINGNGAHNGQEHPMEIDTAKYEKDIPALVHEVRAMIGRALGKKGKRKLASYEQAAKFLKVSQGSVANWQRGLAKPSKKNVAVMVSALQSAPEEVKEKKESPQKRGAKTRKKNETAKKNRIRKFLDDGGVKGATERAQARHRAAQEPTDEVRVRGTTIASLALQNRAEHVAIMLQAITLCGTLPVARLAFENAFRALETH